MTPIARSPAPRAPADLKLGRAPVHRGAGVSEAVYRLAQAAHRPARASRSALAPPLAGEGEAAWYRIRVRPLEGVARHGATAWTVSDITRERERHESFFQDLQHAIDYLDHAPAGFFSAEPDGSIALYERDARQLARLRHRPVHRRPAQARRHRRRRRRGAAQRRLRPARAR